MGQTGAVFIARRIEKHLGLVLETPEGVAEQDTVFVYLKGSTDRTSRFAASGRVRPRELALRHP